jgi:DNA modification methylase
MVNLFQGDCLEIMADAPSESVDLTVTSPPYDNLRTYNGSLTDWNEDKWKAILAELYRITKTGGLVVWVVGDATIKGSESGTSFRQALFAMECGFNLHDTMIWSKGTFTAVGSLVSRYAPVFEYMFVFSKGKPKTFNPIKDRPNKTFGDVHHGKARQRDGSMKALSNPGREIPEYGQRFNIWVVPNPGKAGIEHPATFPLNLAADHILSWSNPGDTVLDPFMGSGTTGVACQNTGRELIGIEQDAAYFAIAEKRLMVAANDNEPVELEVAV